MAFGRDRQVKGPDWFDVRRYHRFFPQNNADWLLQLGFRRDLRRVLQQVFSGGKTAEQLEVHHLAVEFVSKTWAMVREDSIIDLRRLEQHFPEPLPYFPSLSVLFERQPRNHMAVHPTTVGELYQAELMLGREFRSIGEGHIESVEQMSGPLEFGTAPALRLNSILKMKQVVDRKLEVELGDETAEALDLPLYGTSVVLSSSQLFTVNWLLPDKLLLRQFKEALARSRKYLSTIEGDPPQLASNPAEHWHKLQLLAYLDLTTALFFPDARKLSRSEIAVLLWPNGCTPIKQPSKPREATESRSNSTARRLKLWGPEDVKERLEPNADELMSEHGSSFMILEARAAENLAEYSKDPSPSSRMEKALTPPRTRNSRKRTT